MTKAIDGWIPSEEWCTKYAERKNTIHVRVTRDVWQRGVHFSAPDGGRFYVHEARCLEWLKKQKPLWYK
jgi:hypothetical protein